MMKKKLLTALLVLVLLICVLPMAVAAEGEGEGGAPVPAPIHEHTWTIQTVVREADCNVDGHIVYVCACSATYVSYPTAKGHSWKLVSSTPATCDYDGVENYVCERDSSHTYTKPVGKLGHSWKLDNSTATCDNGGVENYICERDSNHTYTKPADKLGHSWKLDSSTPATCDNGGVENYVCERDSKHTYTKPVDKLGHSWKLVSSTPSTCNDAGVENYVCERDNNHTWTKTLPKLEHTWDAGKVTKAATCHSDGVMTYTCTRDAKHTKTEKIPATGAHRLSVTFSDATYHWQYCWNEGCNYVTTGYHEWSRWRVARAATEEKDGLLRKDCAWCNHKRWTSYKYSDNPPTGDVAVIPAMLLLTTGAVLIPTVYTGKKRKNQK